MAMVVYNPSPDIYTLKMPSGNIHDVSDKRWATKLRGVDFDIGTDEEKIASTPSCWKVMKTDGTFVSGELNPYEGTEANCTGPTDGWFIDLPHNTITFAYQSKPVDADGKTEFSWYEYKINVFICDKDKLDEVPVGITWRDNIGTEYVGTMDINKTPIGGIYRTPDNNLWISTGTYVTCLSQRNSLIYTCMDKVTYKDIPNIHQIDDDNMGVLTPQVADRNRVYEVQGPKTVREKSVAPTYNTNNTITTLPLDLDSDGTIKATFVFDSGNVEVEFIKSGDNYLSSDSTIGITKNASGKYTTISLSGTTGKSKEIRDKHEGGEDPSKISFEYISGSDVNRYLYAVADRIDGGGVEWIPVSSAGGSGGGGDVNDPGHKHDPDIDYQIIGFSTQTKDTEIQLEVEHFTPTSNPFGLVYEGFTNHVDESGEENTDEVNINSVGYDYKADEEKLVLDFSDITFKQQEILTTLQMQSETKTAQVKMPAGLALANYSESTDTKYRPYHDAFKDEDFIYEYLYKVDVETGEPILDADGYYVPELDVGGNVQYVVVGDVMDTDATIRVPSNFKIHKNVTGITLE